MTAKQPLNFLSQKNNDLGTNLNFHLSGPNIRCIHCSGVDRWCTLPCHKQTSFPSHMALEWKQWKLLRNQWMGAWHFGSFFFFLSTWLGTVINKGTLVCDLFFSSGPGMGWHQPNHSVHTHVLVYSFAPCTPETSFCTLLQILFAHVKFLWNFCFLLVAQKVPEEQERVVCYRLPRLRRRRQTPVPWRCCPTRSAAWARWTSRNSSRGSGLRTEVRRSVYPRKSCTAKTSLFHLSKWIMSSFSKLCTLLNCRKNGKLGNYCQKKLRKRTQIHHECPSNPHKLHSTEPPVQNGWTKEQLFCLRWPGRQRDSQELLGNVEGSASGFVVFIWPQQGQDSTLAEGPRRPSLIFFSFCSFQQKLVVGYFADGFGEPRGGTSQFSGWGSHNQNEGFAPAPAISSWDGNMLKRGVATQKIEKERKTHQNCENAVWVVFVPKFGARFHSAVTVSLDSFSRCDTRLWEIGWHTREKRNSTDIHVQSNDTQNTLTVLSFNSPTLQLREQHWRKSAI